MKSAPDRRQLRAQAVGNGILDLYGSECGEGTYFVFVVRVPRRPPSRGKWLDSPHLALLSQKKTRMMRFINWTYQHTKTCYIMLYLYIDYYWFLFFIHMLFYYHIIYTVHISDILRQYYSIRYDSIWCLDNLKQWTSQAGWAHFTMPGFGSPLVASDAKISTQVLQLSQSVWGRTFLSMWFLFFSVFHSKFWI